MPDFDTLIVGAGTAGARLATRLALLHPNSRTDSIGLIESGQSHQPIASRVPAWYPWCFGSNVDWAFTTEPQPELSHRALRWPRGRLLGGSGAINALIDIQSSQSDWNRWGWHWAKNADTYDLPPIPEVQQSPHPWNQHFLDACQQVGLKRHDPLQQSSNNICGNFMVARRNGLRAHTGQTVENLSIVKLLLGMTVHSILFDGTRALGVQASHVPKRGDSKGQQLHITANRIILCAGTLGSPELLLRSGIGPRDELAELGIDCRADLGGVGMNLQDHLVMPIVYRTKQAHGLPRIHGHNSRKMLREFGSGSLTSNIAEATALLGASHGTCAEYQIHFTPNHYWKYPFRDDNQSFLSLNVSDLHPRSRGEVRLQRFPPNGELALAIDPKYLCSEPDLSRFADAYIKAIQIAKQSSLAELILEPLTPEASNNTEVGDVVRKFAQSIYHPIGTCAAQSPLEGYAPVVDEQFRVLGMENLWIADASVFPDQPSCNPNRTVILIADRMAQLLSQANVR
jgi:choline dehydrogenase